MRRSFSNSFALCFVLFGSMAAQAKVVDSYGRRTIVTVQDVAEAEAVILHRPKYMENTIAYHRCLTKEAVISEINQDLFFDDRNLSRERYIDFSEAKVTAILEKHTRNEIIAAEVIQLAKMEPYSVLPHAAEWASKVKTAHAAGDKRAENLLMLQIPIVGWASGVEGATAVPFSIIDGAIDLSQQHDCAPINTTK